MPVTSTPSSTSQAAVRNVDAEVLSWWKWPVSNEMPAYRAAAAAGDGRSPSARATSHTSSLVLLASPRTKASSP